ncbi:PH domain-containing protein [Streptomyces sp. Wb2n-11]|uniref:PH domain-containing protein n=1 Tax=Streptomyces sp. Wb2n-11 TaxID=1030533 RepID=UPI000AA80400|nr:PH domain-containing protein [Streptomyces sp. Wb2n-11]
MLHGIQPEPPFTLSGVELTRHPERTVRVSRIATALGVLGVTALLGALGVMVTSAVYLTVTKSRDWHNMLDWWDARMAFIAVLPAAFYAWRWNRIKAAWTFRGYHLGAEELYIRTGLLNRSLTVLAYARIQEVNVSSGPIQRRYSLATVTISSAAGRDAVENVDPQTAHDLRDRLTDLARERRLPV